MLDILVVGGGPAGTAAAFQAKHMGLSTLVVDYDDLMKRIRDYADDKQILPGFGGGDQMQFPDGGEMIRSLHFSAIDKDDMCSQWKELYRRYDVASRIGVELMGLLPGPEGAWTAELWNHEENEEETIDAKHVVLAFGRGVPRRLDIPDAVDGLAFRMADPQEYVGAPCCVIGGGTSSAEAVIAISEAKAAADDAAPVWWSYRGDKMPKVSKALADAFFAAYVGNGNVRYLPRSEPVAVVTAQEERDYLCIRTDRKILEDRPSETTHLEFPMSHCVACIGEDIPAALLAGMGIEMVTGGPKNRQRLVVSPNLETAQPNVYLIGDILSPAYLETDDFKADPLGFAEIKRRGNIKSALRDGVFVAQAIAQKLEGHEKIHVHLEFVAGEGEAAASASPDAEAAAAATAAAAPDATPAAAPDATPAAASPAAFVQAGGEPEADAPNPRLVRLLQGGVEADEYALGATDRVTIGRGGCDVSFEGDPLLSEVHAAIARRDGGYYLESPGEAGDTFLRVTESRALLVPPGAVVRVGKQWLVFGDETDRCSFTHYDHRGRAVGRHEVPGRTIVVGRQAPDVTLDRQDKALSRRHLAVSAKTGEPTIRDLKSGNGTFLKIDEPTKLEEGDEFGLGRQLLRFTVAAAVAPAADVRFDTGITRIDRAILKRRSSDAATVADAPQPGAAARAADSDATDVPASAEGSEPMVTFQGLGKSFPVRDGQTICELAEEHGIEITVECRSGICGSDPIRIVSGEEHLHPMGADEEATLEEICDLAPQGHRVACMARPTGPVVIEIIES